MSSAQLGHLSSGGPALNLAQGTIDLYMRDCHTATGMIGNQLVQHQGA